MLVLFVFHFGDISSCFGYSRVSFPMHAGEGMLRSSRLGDIHSIDLACLKRKATSEIGSIKFGQNTK